MADLDDFFAKKDRKKSKSKKYATPQSEDNTSNEVKSKKLNVGDEVDSNQPPEDEWKEFEEERKDYSGLKIGQLTILEEEQNQTNYGGDPDDNFDGESDGEEGAEGSDRKRSGPWKKVSSTEPQQSSTSTTAPAVTAVKQPSKLYISPAMRNEMAQPSKPKLKKGVLPDLASEDYFPSLGTDKPDSGKNRKDATFEEVKHGGRMKPSDMASAAPLSVAQT